LGTIFLYTLSIIGCHSNADPNKNTEKYLPFDIYWKDYAWIEIPWTDSTGATKTALIDKSVHFEDIELQKRIKTNNLNGYISTEEEITAYSWELIDELVALEYLSEDCVPMFASHFSHGVWGIYYIKEEWNRPGVRDGTIDVYVSEEDGHIIFINHPGL
jgi:hypothetical protein